MSMVRDDFVKIFSPRPVPHSKQTGNRVLMHIRAYVILAIRSP